LDGRTVGRGRLLGQVTIIEFVTSRCGPCQQLLGALARQRKAMGRDVRILVVDVAEPAETVAKRLKRRKLPGDVDLVLDRHGQTAKRWGVRALPAAFVIDRLGMVRLRVDGDAGAAGRLAKEAKAALPLH
jgi:thiol-disulfide isomerase/thioredoxin